MKQLSEILFSWVTTVCGDVDIFIQDKEIYLLDDPLAAVDVHVAAHIFKHCIMGILKDKTR